MQNQTEIQLDDNLLKELKSIIFPEVATSTDMQYGIAEEQEFLQLQKAAKRFIGVLNNFSKKSSVTVIDDILNNQSAADYQHLLQKAKKRLRFGLNVNKVTNAIVDFEEAFNTFMHRTISLTLVTEDGRIFFYNTKEQKKIYRKSRGAERRLAQLAFTTRKKDFLNIDIDNYMFTQLFTSQIQQEHARAVKQTYDMAMERYQETHISSSAQNENNFYYWHESSNQRTYAYIKNKGVLGEAYVAALFSNPQKAEFYNHATDPDNLKNLFYNYILHTDNRSGIALGDIANDILSPMQLAVKTKGASSQSFLNLISIANLLITSPTSLTRQSLKEWILAQEEDSSNREFNKNPLIANLDKNITDEVISKITKENPKIVIKYASM